MNALAAVCSLAALAFMGRDSILAVAASLAFAFAAVVCLALGAKR